MTREETKKIVDKIQIHRQSFLITNNVYLEWYRILEPYDYEDVDSKLDNFLKNGDNFGRYPDAFYLIKYLTPHEEKLKEGINYVRCKFCGQAVDVCDYSDHHDICSSADYICTMSLKYFDKQLNHESLIKLNKTEFEKYYYKFCEKLYNSIEDGLQKHVLKNVILTKKGFEPEFNLERISREIENVGRIN